MTAVKHTAAEKKAAAAAAKAAEAELKAQAEAKAAEVEAQAQAAAKAAEAEAEAQAQAEAKAAEAELKAQAEAEAQVQTGSTDESGNAEAVGENPLKDENTGDTEAVNSDQAEETLALGPLQLRVTNHGNRGHCRVSKQVIESGETVTIDYANTQLKQLAKGNFAQLNAFSGRQKRFIVEG